MMMPVTSGENVMAYRVEIWGSRKDLGNDDHWFDGEDHPSLEAAMAELPSLKAIAEGRVRSGWGYACVEGPEGRAHEEVNAKAPSPDHDDGARSEFATQQGMTFGVDALNEANGEEVEQPSFGPR